MAIDANLKEKKLIILYYWEVKSPYKRPENTYL